LAAIAAAATLLASVAAACGGAGSSAPPGSPSQQQANQDIIDFAHCMRAHGVNVPDPVHESGHQGLSIQMPQRTAANQAAFTACTPHIQALINAKLSAARQHAAPNLPSLLRYARCMRAHAIPMLDPDQYGELNLGRIAGIPNTGRYTPQFRAADAACRHLLPSGTPDNGTGP
jgi:hypothetical protein